MTQRKHSPEHDFWTPRVEGQIRHTIGQHPEWFTFKTEFEKRTLVNSLAKRIVGEIVAASSVARMPEVDGGRLSSQAARGDEENLSPLARSMPEACAPGITPIK